MLANEHTRRGTSISRRHEKGLRDAVYIIIKLKIREVNYRKNEISTLFYFEKFIFLPTRLLAKYLL